MTHQQSKTFICLAFNSSKGDFMSTNRYISSLVKSKFLFLWYNKPTMHRNKKLVVPILFDPFYYHTEKPIFTWIFEIYANYCMHNDMPLIAQENYFNQKINLLNKTYDVASQNIQEKETFNTEIKKFVKYSITNEETRSISEGKKATLKDQIKFLSSTSKEYIKFINNKLDKIEKDYSQKVDVILTWYWNPSLESIAKERNLQLITQEISPIRHGNYRIMLSYFSFSNKFDSNYCQDLFYEFQRKKNQNFKILSREELLALLLNTEDLKLIKELQKPPMYELGISPPFEDDFFYEIHKNESLDTTIATINKMFKPKNVTIRYREKPNKKIGNPNWNLDCSTKAIYWVLKCKRVLTYVSNIAFDAMLFGKTVYLLSDDMPFSFNSLNHFQYKDESVVETEYLNFMIFGYFVPWNLMLNQEYIEWRLTNPSIVDIYTKHQNYILSQVGFNKTKDISLSQILKVTHGLQVKDIKDIEKYSELEYIESLKKDNLNLSEQITSNILQIENLTEEIQELIDEVEEFKSFQQGAIWKFLTIWRKFKNTIKNRGHF